MDMMRVHMGRLHGVRGHSFGRSQGNGRLDINVRNWNTISLSFSP
jgi:hypothetical protein